VSPAVPNPRTQAAPTTPDTGNGTPTLAVPTVGVAGRYSNRPDLLEQLRRVVAILSDSRQDDGTGAKVAAECVVRSRRLRDRFSLEDLRAMIDLYGLGTSACEMAEKYGVSPRSIKRLLRQHGVRRER